MIISALVYPVYIASVVYVVSPVVLENGGRKTVAAVAGAKLDPSYLHGMLIRASKRQSGNRYSRVPM